MDPLSLMPQMKSLFSDKQVEQLTAYVEQRSGKSGLLRYAGQIYAKHIVTANQGFAGADIGFQGADKPRSSRGTTRSSIRRRISSRRHRTWPRSTAATGSPAIRCP